MMTNDESQIGRDCFEPLPAGNDLDLSTKTATIHIAAPSLSLPKGLQALLDDPNLLFVRPIPSATKWL